MRPYSQDIRERIIQAYLNGEGSQRVIARRFTVSLSFVRDLLCRFRRTGTFAPAPRRSFPSYKLDAESLALLLQLAANNPTLSLSVFVEFFHADEISESVAARSGARSSAISKCWRPQPNKKSLQQKLIGTISRPHHSQNQGV